MYSELKIKQKRVFEIIKDKLIGNTKRYHEGDDC